MVGFVLVSVVSFCCIMGALRNPSAPIPHDSLHRYGKICHLYKKGMVVLLQSFMSLILVIYGLSVGLS